MNTNHEYKYQCAWTYGLKYKSLFKIKVWGLKLIGKGPTKNNHSFINKYLSSFDHYYE